MAYPEFSLNGVQADFGITATPAKLFQGLVPADVPGWLRDQLARGNLAPRVSEKARSEYIVAPILLACSELSGGEITVFSGSRLDADAARGLVGECDFLLARAPAIPSVHAPILAVVEAKKGDIEAALGQCLAQALGAQLWNEREGKPLPAIYGCVTSGDVWQFLRLESSTAFIDDRRYYLDNLPGILGVLAAIVRKG